MRVLLLLRGAPGCGKSTWIEQHGLKNYAISADEIRMLFSSPTMTVEGNEVINQDRDRIVWTELFRILETRMANGEFTVIDATNSKTVEMNRYKELCDNYKYRIYCVDFTDVPIEIAKERNKMRPSFKHVPDEAIEKMYSRFKTQKIPSGITVLRPDELDKIWLRKIDLSHYKRIHHIGDIHGCNTALQEYLNTEGGIKDDEFYIFCGDLLDRGIENADVLRFVLSVYEKPNCFFIEGNHERHLWVWANEGVCESKEFELITKTQLDDAGIDKKEVRRFYRKIAQCAYYQYGDNTYLVTHGGLSAIPYYLTTVSTEQMIKGVGRYNDAEAVANSFMKNTDQNVYQIHGHRNTKSLPTQVNERVFNLEGRVEFGGCLRCVQILPGGIHNIVEIHNTVYKEQESQIPDETVKTENSVGDTIIALRKSRYIQEKRYGNISAFNFTKQAFCDKIWDEQTIKARGLYINIPEQKVVARAYDKFFNINERPETKFAMLQNKLAFPVRAYVKENGFLGIVSYNTENDSLFVTTKTCPDGEYAAWFYDMLRQAVSEGTLDAIKEYTKEHNVSFVFECVDMKNDPHIIDYENSAIYLLDIVYNDINYQKYDFDKLCDIANKFGFIHKEHAFTIETWQDFFDWYYEVMDEDYKYNGRHIEGFVLEDNDGYMVKLKLQYYNFWKFMRSVAHEVIRTGHLNGRRTAALTTPCANQFHGWIKSLRETTEDIESIPRDICTLRKLFFLHDESESEKRGVS